MFRMDTLSTENSTVFFDKEALVEGISHEAIRQLTQIYHSRICGDFQLHNYLLPAEVCFVRVSSAGSGYY